MLDWRPRIISLPQFSLFSFGGVNLTTRSKLHIRRLSLAPNVTGSELGDGSSTQLARLHLHSHLCASCNYCECQRFYPDVCDKLLSIRSQVVCDFHDDDDVVVVVVVGVVVASR